VGVLVVVCCSALNSDSAAFITSPLKLMIPASTHKLPLRCGTVVKKVLLVRTVITRVMALFYRHPRHGVKTLWLVASACDKWGPVGGQWRLSWCGGVRGVGATSEATGFKAVEIKIVENNKNT
jgi:hypothetical protein